MPMREGVISVSEIFGPTVQGEGPQIGLPTIFVRTGGCDYRCVWCDTMYAVDPKYRDNWEKMEPAAIMEQVVDLAGGVPLLITLSGGNPALQPLDRLIELGHARGFTFSIETQGTVSRAWFSMLDQVVISPKPPSSGMPFDQRKLERCLAAAGNTPVALKVPVFDMNDYEFARSLQPRYEARLPIYLSVGNPAPLHGTEADTRALLDRYAWLVDRVRADRWYSVRLLPQLHVLIWGNRRGV